MITQHDSPKAVLISVENFNALSAQPSTKLDTLSQEFDALLARMQTSTARRGMKAAFAASGKRWGGLRSLRRARVASSRRRRCIYVLAGTNGAGKSSVAGSMFRQAGTDYSNPDEATARILAANLIFRPQKRRAPRGMRGNASWNEPSPNAWTSRSKRHLAGTLISARLKDALAAGIEGRIVFMGLSSPDWHMARV